MGVGRGWKIMCPMRNRAIWIVIGILLVQGTLGEPNNATDQEAAESVDSGVEVVSLVKKDKRQAQRGYTDVPLDRGPFDELIASSPAPIAFENDLPTFVDSLSDLADAAPHDYNPNKFPNYGPPNDGTKANLNTGIVNSALNQPNKFSPSTPGPSPSPSTKQSIVITNNNLGPLLNVGNVSRPASFFNQQPFITFNNGVPFGPVGGPSGFSGPGITPTGPLTDSLALPDSTAAEAINIERRQADIPVSLNEPPPFNGKAIPGDAGIDYPIYGEIPKTSFSCKDHQWPGYYADTQARCQVFWICQKHRMDGFLCPNGTLFNQQVFVCDWWFNVDCGAAPEFYSRNQYVYAGPGIGIDGQPVRGFSLPIAATNRVSKVLPPQPSFGNALLGPSITQGSQVQSSNQVARVTTITARPLDFQTRADSLNNFLKSSPATGPSAGGQSYQRELVNRLQSTPNKLHEPPVRATTLAPFRDTDRRIPAASSQISQAQVTSGTSRPTVAHYQPQHVETVSIVTTPNPTSRSTTARPPPPPIPKFNISPTPKPIKGPSPTPFANVIKLGTTVTISSTPRPEFSTKTSLFKGIISSTAKPPKIAGLKLSSSNILQTKAVTRPSEAPRLLPRPFSTEDPTNTVRPPDYHPQRAPDPTPPGSFSAPGYLPSSRPNTFTDNSGFGKESKNFQFFVSSTGRPLSSLSHGMRSNQFSNTNGQRENIYASSRKDTFIEFPYSPSQQKNKQRLQEVSSNKDISSSKNIVTAIPHFYGQRSNVFSGSDSFSFISNNNKRVLIDHTHYSQRQGPFVKTSQGSGGGQVHHENLYQHVTAPSAPLPQHVSPPQSHSQNGNNLHQQHPSAPSPQQYFSHTGPSHPTQGPVAHQQHHQPQLQVTSKPEQRYFVTPSPTPQHYPSPTAEYHQQPLSHPSSNIQIPLASQQRPLISYNDAVTPRDGFTPLNAGSFISIQTTAPPFSQQILRHNSLQPQPSYHEGNGNRNIAGGIISGPPPTPQQVIFSSTPTNNNFEPFVSSTAAPRTFDHGPSPQQQGFHFPSSPQPHVISSTSSPYFESHVTGAPNVALHSTPTPYSAPNNFIAAPTQSPIFTTSPGHRQNPYLPHNHGKQKAKQQQRPASLSAVSPATFPQGGITTTIKYPEGTGKLRLDFSGGGGNRRNIVDFHYSASPTSSPSNYVSSSTTPFPSSAERFSQTVSSTTARPIAYSSPFPAPASSSGRSSGRYAGAVTNKSNLSSSAIYVDTAATAESVSTPVTVPSPSSTASPLPPVSTSNYGLRLSATAKKRMTGAWQSYFSPKSE